ncbi:predicted protein [Botrytis cinerea T4]|uniref:Uncharacterized protein n=1 Tax=Botryotinia fuckeliana (strain T4) TaxID=999810 RepID=G2YZG0_BOTF4|nr:predicted protein [Botrytis cinerea T4]
MGFGYIAFQYDKRAPTTGLTRTNLPFESRAVPSSRVGISDVILMAGQKV